MYFSCEYAKYYRLLRASLMTACAYYCMLLGQRGNTPLVLASWKGHEAVVKCLLKHEADISAVENVSDTRVWITLWGTGGGESIGSLPCCE